jgi:hypothetical protein
LTYFGQNHNHIWYCLEFALNQYPNLEPAMAKIVLRILSLVVLLGGAATPVWAQTKSHADKAVDHGAQASSNASASAAHALIASGQVTSAIASAPLALSGTVLGASAQASTGLAQAPAMAATTPIGTPLPIAEESVSIMPPDAALKTNTQVN